MNQKTLLAIVGATATGKTELAIAVAQHFNTAIISFDGRQFYKEMSIGTAKPSREELEAAPHYFIGNKSIAEAYTVADFEQEALAQLAELFQTTDLVVAVGGSGLFIRALMQGLDQIPPVDASIVAELERIATLQGLLSLQTQLAELDPVSYQELDINNPRRLVRALSVCLSSGQPFSSYKTKQPQARPFQTLMVGIEYERAALYDRINRRVDMMMQNGLEQEAKSLYPYRELSSLQTVGYTELFDYFEQKNNLAQAVELIKQHSRNYAKRQITWFKREPIKCWLSGALAMDTKIKTLLDCLADELPDA